jgi:hypothetical protein
VVALPLLPNTNIIKGLEKKVNDIFTIGDSHEPRLMVDAIADGARIGHQI